MTSIRTQVGDFLEIVWSEEDESYIAVSPQGVTVYGNTPHDCRLELYEQLERERPRGWSK